jgi:hypothetical protein
MQSYYADERKLLHVYTGGAEHGYHSETAKCAGKDSDRGFLDCPFRQTREREIMRDVNFGCVMKGLTSRSRTRGRRLG